MYHSNLFVDQYAPAAGDGLSWATAFQTIKAAVTVVNDTIFISVGIYRPNATQDTSVPLSIKGGYTAGRGNQGISKRLLFIVMQDQYLCR